MHCHYSFKKNVVIRKPSFFLQARQQQLEQEQQEWLQQQMEMNGGSVPGTLNINEHGQCQWKQTALVSQKDARTIKVFYHFLTRKCWFRFQFSWLNNIGGIRYNYQQIILVFRQKDGTYTEELKGPESHVLGKYLYWVLILNMSFKLYDHIKIYNQEVRTRTGRIQNNCFSEVLEYAVSEYIHGILAINGPSTFRLYFCRKSLINQYRYYSTK